MNLSEKNNPRTRKHPERILQFGTGVLLRGLCDFYIDKANKSGHFDGSIVVVKSMAGEVDLFENQDNLYTVCVRGIENGKNVVENVICESISRVLIANNHWDEILKTAENKEIDIILSNTTEVGLQYVYEKSGIPTSFPGKLTSWLFRRFSSNLAGVVIIPTELVVDNGTILKNLVLKHAYNQTLGAEFTSWLESENHFCNSLVDRIVPGKPGKEELEELYLNLGYQDELIVKAEVYSLWAIEGGENVKSRLAFEKADPRIVIEPNITQYRELKLRMLNAPHILMCGLCYLADFETVKDALNNDIIEKYISNLMLSELAPSLPENIDPKVVQRYGREIIDRFRNPYLDHKWLSITFQYTMKMRMRAIPLLQRYFSLFGNVPHYYARGFSAYLMFMKVQKVENGKYYGLHNNAPYEIIDDQAEWYYEAWKSKDSNEVCRQALKNIEFWGMDLTLLPGFEDAVSTHLSNMEMIGVREVVSALNVYA